MNTTGIAVTSSRDLPDEPLPERISFMQVIALTGPCSAGKSTTAVALQQLLPDRWRFFEVDRTQPTGKPLTLTGSESRAELAELLEIDHSLRRANMKAARAYVDEGFRLVVEMDLSGEWSRLTWLEVFAGIRAPVILLTADPFILQRRLSARRDRLHSQAAYDEWPRGDYALVVSTDDRSPDWVARAILHSRLPGGVR